MHLQNFSADIILQISQHLNVSALSSLLKTNSFFAALLAPKFHNLALQPKAGFPAIIWAASHGHDSLIELIISKDKNVSIETPYSPFKFTPLHCAAHHGNASTVLLLLQKGANIEALSQTKATPLHLATRSWRKVAKRLLRECNLDSEWKLDEHVREDLWKISLALSEATVKVLLEHGANVNARDEFNDSVNSKCTPLHWCLPASTDGKRFLASAGKNGLTLIPLIRLLLSYGADINATSNYHITTIQRAVHYSTEKEVKFLLDSGADIGIRSHDRKTTLHHAVIANRCSLVTLLLAHEADPNARDIFERTPLHDAVTRGTDNPDIVEELLENGAEVNAMSHEGNAAIHVAVDNGSWENVKLLLAHGADVDVTGNQEETPLDIALRRGDQRIVDLLTESGVRGDTDVAFLVEEKEDDGIRGLKPYTYYFESTFAEF